MCFGEGRGHVENSQAEDMKGNNKSNICWSRRRHAEDGLRSHRGLLFIGAGHSSRRENGSGFKGREDEVCRH